MQEEAIKDYHEALANFESANEVTVQSIIQKWTAPLLECQVHARPSLEKKMRDEWTKVKRYSDIQAAKRAGLILATGNARNHDISMLISDVMLCFSVLRDETLVFFINIE